MNSKSKIESPQLSSELLQKVRVIDPVSGIDRIADVLIVEGVIQAVEENIAVSPETSVRDCRGLVLGPGLVDLYSHSGEPGFEERETLDSLSQAAAAGGFTRLTILPDTTPAIDNPATLALLQRDWGMGTRQKEEKQGVQESISPAPLPLCPSAPLLSFWAALTLGVQGQQMTESAELAAAGAVGFADGQPLSNLTLVRRLLEYLQPLGKPVALWPCDKQLVGNGVMREGTESIRLGLPGNPAISETSALAALLEVVESTGTPVHIMRVSTRRAVELIQVAQKRGLPITASTTWMHLLLTTEDVGSYDPNLRLEPPLGNLSDRESLIEAMRQGVLSAIAIDHTPYTYEEKTVAFAEAPAGAIGLELALPLLWQNLVETGKLSALELWRGLSTQPAECLHQNPAAIAAGQPAELTLFSPQQTWKVEGKTLKSLSANTSWLGQELTGRVVQTWCPHL